MLAVMAMLSAAAAAGAPTDGCLRVMRPVRERAVLTSGDVEVTACEAPSDPVGLAFDRGGRSWVAARDLEAGERLARPAAFDPPAIRAGERVRVQARVGAVVLQREAEALQTARRGRALFVRTADGETFTVAVPETAP